jgi:glycosyltransferase involved in cell wall biosynthesis
VDVVHAFNLSWESGIVAAAGFARRRALPLALTPFAHFGAGTSDRVARNSTMDHQLALLRSAERVLVLTEVERQELTGLGIDRDRLSVIDSGSDPPPPGWQTSAYTSPGRLPEPYAVFVGRASADKGALHAAQAAMDLRRSGHALSLVLVGSTTDEFARFHARLRPEERQAILPLGVVDEVDKHAIISRSRMLVLPSRSDSFGIVLLEAWAHELPVIGARAGGIPAVVDDGINGLLVDYGDVTGLATEMRRLLEDPPLAARLGINGRARLGERYTWPGVAAKVSAVYHDMTGGTG